jgi:HSP20 family protein
MAITPYRPTTDIFGSLLDEYLRPTNSWGGGRMGGMMRNPEADVVETEDHIQVTVELPGMKPEEINIDLENNVLTIAGEKHEEREEKNNTWHLSERRYGSFSRSFVLPRDVEQDKISAHFENGILRVRIPKSEKARRRKIEVRNENGGQQRVETGGGQQRAESAGTQNR